MCHIFYLFNLIQLNHFKMFGDAVYTIFLLIIFGVIVCMLIDIIIVSLIYVLTKLLVISVNLSFGVVLSL